MNNDLEQFSEERLIELSRFKQASELAALARIALAAKQSKPVAYMYRDNLHSDARFSLTSQIGNWSSEEIIEHEITEIPLYTTPQPAHTEQVIPSEIPKVPHNGVMAYKKDGSIYSTNYARGWNDCIQAMLAAAPKPESD